MNNEFLFNFLKNNSKFYPSKKLGQNFLTDDNYKKKIVDSIELKDSDIVFEIGPGFGSITDYILLHTNKLYLIEFDKRIFETLSLNYKNLKIFNSDILTFNLEKEIKKFKEIFVVSNLPYSISSKIMFKLVQVNKIKKMVLMFQKEFAEKLLDTKKINKINILVNNFFTLKKLFVVPKNSFYPRPKIDSEVILFIRKEKTSLDYKKLSSFINVCFLQPRKKLFSNLAKIYKKEFINLIFNKLEINLNERVENLSEKKFIDMFLSFNEKK